MKRVLHLMRARREPSSLPAGPPAALLGAADWVVDVSGAAPRLSSHGAPALPPGSITFDELRQLIAAADLVVTW